jgi:hypothetical protein
VAQLHLKIDANHEVEAVEAYDSTAGSTRNQVQHQDDAQVSAGVQTSLAVAVAGLVLAVLALLTAVLAYCKVRGTTV